MDLHSEHRALILTAGERYRDLLASPEPPAWQTWTVQDRALQIEYGVPYSSAEWFGSLTDAERMRFQRAIAELERHGVIVCWRRYGRRLTSFRLTPLGEQIETAIRAEQTGDSTADLGGGI